MEKVNIVKIKTQYSIGHTHKHAWACQNKQKPLNLIVFILEKILLKLNKVKVN